MNFIPKYFKIEELVPPEYIQKYSKDSLWKIFDPNILIFADMMREKFGSCIINDWLWGGTFEYSGLRPESWYNHPSMSLHIYARALDMKFKNATAEEVRIHIKSNINLYSKYVHGIENGVDWLHGDTRNYNGILFFNK